MLLLTLAQPESDLDALTDSNRLILRLRLPDFHALSDSETLNRLLRLTDANALRLSDTLTLRLRVTDLNALNESDLLMLRLAETDLAALSILLSEALTDFILLKDTLATRAERLRLRLILRRPLILAECDLLSDILAF